MAGLLTCSGDKRPSRCYPVATDGLRVEMELTAAGLFGIFTRFPFNLHTRGVFRTNTPAKVMFYFRKPQQTRKNIFIAFAVKTLIRSAKSILT